MKANQSESNADKAQLVESRQYQLGDMARIVGLPPHLLFDLSRSTNNNIEHQGIEAVTYSFKPWANKLMQEANRKLLYESEKGTFETIIDLKPLQQGDAKTQAERDQIRFNCGALTPNEIRELDGRNPIEGGDTLFMNCATMPLNLIVEKALADMAIAKAALVQPIDPEDDAEIEQAETAGQDTDPTDPDDNTPPEGDKPYDDGPVVAASEVEDAAPLGISTGARALRPIIAAEVKRLIRRDAKAVRSALAKYASDPEGYMQWRDSYTAETRQHVAEVLAPICQTIADMGAAKPVVQEIAANYVARTLHDMTQLFALSPADRADALLMTIEGWHGLRSDDLITDIIGE